MAMVILLLVVECVWLNNVHPFLRPNIFSRMARRYIPFSFALRRGGGWFFPDWSVPSTIKSQVIYWTVQLNRAELRMRPGTGWARTGIDPLNLSSPPQVLSALTQQPFETNPSKFWRTEFPCFCSSACRAQIRVRTKVGCKHRSFSTISCHFKSHHSLRTLLLLI